MMAVLPMHTAVRSSSENTVIVMTSNAGSQHKTASLGFGGTVSDMGKERAIKALEDIMRPEFLKPYRRDYRLQSAHRGGLQ